MSREGSKRPWLKRVLGRPSDGPPNYSLQRTVLASRAPPLSSGSLGVAISTTPMPRAREHTLYGAAASGSVAVEAALTLLNIPFKLIEGATWTSEAARKRVGAQNAMRQIPTLVLPDSEILTESAGILIYLADVHREAKLSPGLNEPSRGQFLRWMFFVSSAIYSLHWIKPDVTRIGAPESARNAVVEAVHKRIAFCWRTMDAQLNPAKYLLGDDLSVLDLYVAVVSRFGPWRDRFYVEAPRMTPVIKRIDEEPRLKVLWESRFPRK